MQCLPRRPVEAAPLAVATPATTMRASRRRPIGYTSLVISQPRRTPDGLAATDERSTNPMSRPSSTTSDDRRPALSVPQPPWLDRALEALIVAGKAATIACAIDGFVNADTPRFRGKGIRARAFGYTACLFLVPVLWRILPNRGRYTRGLDLAVTLPLLIDAAGNSV